MTQSKAIPATHKPTSKPLLPPRRQEYAYHWSRIFGVGVILLVLGGIAVYGILWFSSAPQVGMELAEALPEAKIGAESQWPNLDDERIQQSIDEGSATFTEQEPMPAQVAEDPDSMPSTLDIVKPLLEEAVILEEDDWSQQHPAGVPLETKPYSTELVEQPGTDLAGLEIAEEASSEPVYSADSESVAETETPEELLAAPAEDELVPPQAETSEELLAAPTEDELVLSQAETSEELLAAPAEDELVLSQAETPEELLAAPMEDELVLPQAETPEELLAAPAENELVLPQAEISEEIPSDPPAENPDSDELILTADTPIGLFQLEELKIIEPEVKRFLLTRAIAEKEPLGELSDVSFDTEGYAVVWSFSEVVDMQGSWLNYVWLHEGSEIARVPVKIWGNRWRSYSSKRFNQSMAGAWRLELQDGEGHLLASADFLL